MRLPRFLDCALTILFEDLQRVGLDVSSAFDRLSEWASGGGAGLREEAGEGAPARDMSAENDRALAALAAQMGAVGGMPG